MKVFVLTWRYGDGSASGVVDVFSTLEAAQRVVGYLEIHGHAKYEIHEKEVV